MADLPDLEEIEENQKLADEYEHPEQATPEGGCSNLAEKPDDLNTGEEDEGSDEEVNR